MSVDPADEEFDEVERYELRERKPYSFQSDRREFVQILGAGIVIAVSAKRSEAQRRSARRDEPLSDRFHFGEDGVITVMTSKVEVGQGSRTQLTQAAAEEFRVPADRIRLIMADTELCPDDGGTAGSRTTPSTVPRVRNAAAAARDLLLKMAAEKLDTDNVVLTNGELKGSDGKSTSLVELIKNESFQNALQSAPASSEITLTAVPEWKVLGTSVPKVDVREIVTGSHRYPSDIIRPGMLYGKVLRPPVYGATLKSIDVK
ncbi:MAG: molybdopterin-dependent oxidoreductase, partial [Planctomycetales bacterium]|nr:molybdopterin-dependent oxidoreductase [Planctomycetales bacterium]